jgi:hypothetical protein
LPFDSLENFVPNPPGVGGSEPSVQTPGPASRPSAPPELGPLTDVMLDAWHRGESEKVRAIDAQRQALIEAAQPQSTQPGSPELPPAAPPPEPFADEHVQAIQNNLRSLGPEGEKLIAEWGSSNFNEEAGRAMRGLEMARQEMPAISDHLDSLLVEIL